MKSRKSAMYRLLFADEKGAVYDHPRLLAAARAGGDVVRPTGGPVPLPEGATLCVLPGRRPVGFDPDTGELVVLREARVGRRTFAPVAVGATLPPGYTRTLLPGSRPPSSGNGRGARSSPVGLHRRGLLAGGARGLGAAHRPARATGTRRATPRPISRACVEERLARADNPVYRQLARCALQWYCFTAQNTFYGRDEGAIPASAACNARCVGCLSETADGMPPSSHDRILRAPTAEEMAEVGAEHLATATGRTMVSFGQGCEGEPLLRWKEIARAIRLVRQPDPARVDQREHQRLDAGGAGRRSPRPGSTRSASPSTPPPPISTRPTIGR